MHISLAAEHLFTLWGIPFTNTLIAEFVVLVTLGLIAFFAGRKATLIPNKLQNFFEMIIDFALNYMQTVLGSRKLAMQYFPLLATVFLFIAASNLFDFVPLVGSIGIWEHGELVPLLRPVNTDLNATLALAIIAVFSIEIAGILSMGFFRYLSKFFTLSSPLNFTVGLIEFVSEMSRFVSFSFRLFGNIFAGEVLLGVVAYFMPYVLPVPLMAFETFVGVIQAVVFSMLMLFFIKLAITPPHGADSHAAH